MTKFEKLQDFINNAKIRKQDIRNSLNELLTSGETSTGRSSWVSKRYGAKKDVWTQEISEILTRLDITHECGNNAPRGGANGEYVKIIMPAFIKVVKKNNAERIALWKAEAEARKVAEEHAKKQREEHEERMKGLVEENRKEIESQDIMEIVSNIQHIVLTRKIEKEITHAISNATNIDYQICLWWVRLYFEDYRNTKKQEYISKLMPYLEETITPDEDNAYVEAHTEPRFMKYHRPMKEPQAWVYYIGECTYPSSRHNFFYERFGIEDKMKFAVNEYAWSIVYGKSTNN